MTVTALNQVEVLLLWSYKLKVTVNHARMLRMHIWDCRTGLLLHCCLGLIFLVHRLNLPPISPLGIWFLPPEHTFTPRNMILPLGTQLIFTPQNMIFTPGTRFFYHSEHDFLPRNTILPLWNIFSGDPPPQAIRVVLAMIGQVLNSNWAGFVMQT